MSELRLSTEGRSDALQALFSNDKPFDTSKKGCPCCCHILSAPDDTIVHRALAAYEVSVDIAAGRPYPKQSLIHLWVPAVSYYLLRLKQTHRDLVPFLKDYFRHELKYDYIGPKSLLIIRNPTRFDNALSEAIAKVLKLHVRRLPDTYTKALDGSLKEALRVVQYPSVYEGDPADFESGETIPINATRRTPDVGVFYLGPGGSMDVPILVVEVGTGDKAAELENLAKWYLDVGKGVTKVVIAVAVSDQIRMMRYKLHSGDRTEGSAEIGDESKVVRGGVGFQLKDLFLEGVLRAAQSLGYTQVMSMEWKIEFREIAEVLKM